MNMQAAFKRYYEEDKGMLYLITVASLIFSAQNFMVTGKVETVSEGYAFTEGPLYLPDGTLIFSDIPSDTIFKHDKSVFRRPSGESNGLTLDREGRLIACEHKNRRVSRTESNGTITVLAERYEGKRLNSPNDVIVRSDGTLFFTDPSYGLPGGLEDPQAELNFCGVYGISPQGVLRLLADDFIKPNGLALSPDEKILYIADTEGKQIRAFDAESDGTLSNGRIFCELPGPDGIKTDRQGFLWSTASDGVRVYDPQGTLVETIPFPQTPSNCAFGGDNSRILYVTARKGVYKIRTSHEGLHPLNAPKSTKEL
ncbi:MAG: Gluconolactonase precursor [Candidatus Hydrogenedentes bacterium ADurb.Bin179]|nr:MAG: Gluconolactonase precursor [Candidatus Hydrogenedentes bacterium ADurb.Bin179]